MDLSSWIARKQDELRSLGPVQTRNITPSIRDFSHAVTTHRQALAVIGEIARRTPEEGALADAPDIPALCQAMEDTSVSAVAVATDGVACGGSPADLQAAAGVSTLPVLQRDLVITRDQVYRARLSGADAVLLTAATASPQELRALMEIAASMHMAGPVEIRSEQELSTALAVGARMVVVPAFDGERLSLALAEALLPRVPRAVTPLVRGPFRVAEELEPLRGRADGIWLCGPLMRAPEPAALLQPLVQAAENG